MTFEEFTKKNCVYSVTALYNCEKYILGALDSIVGQDYPNKGISVADDASTDNSFEVVRQSIEKRREWSDKTKTMCEGFYKDVPITLVGLKQNGKQARARNECLKAVGGKCTLFNIIDSDDEARPTKLTKSARLFYENAYLGMVYTDSDIYHTDKDLTIREFREPYSRERLWQECISHSNCMISREAFQKVGFYDEGISPIEDYDIAIRISQQFLISHIPEALVLYRVTGQNTTFTVPPETWQKQHQKLRAKYV